MTTCHTNASLDLISHFCIIHIARKNYWSFAMPMFFFRIVALLHLHTNMGFPAIHPVHNINHPSAYSRNHYVCLRIRHSSRPRHHCGGSYCFILDNSVLKYVINIFINTSDRARNSRYCIYYMVTVALIYNSFLSISRQKIDIFFVLQGMYVI